MDEAQWLASDDPAAMLEAVRDKCGGGWPGGGWERKVRLWVEACRGHAERADPGRTWSWGNLHSQSALDQILSTWGGESFASAVPLSLRAHILRDIVGNPFRPVKLPFGRLGSAPCPDCPDGEPDGYCDDCSGDGTVAVWGCPWLTPTVVSLAQAAYDERAPARPHKRCGCGRAYEMLKRSSTPPMAWCNNCRAEGGWYADAVARESDGSLDPFRLALLADALEEAGCDDRAVLNGLRGLAPCAHDAGPCDDCGGSGWRPSPVPRYRGFWPLDLVLGRE